jgi:type II secretion system protein N
VKKATRVALIVAGVIFGAVVTALLAVNLYVQSHTTQARIQQELSQRLGTTLRIQRISVTPWWGLKLTGITMPQDTESIPGDFLHAKTFRLRIQFGSLFAQRLVIKEISLINPKVVWAQNADGKWRLPSSLRTDGAAATEEVAAASPPAVAGTPVPPPREVAPGPDADDEAPFTPEIRRVMLTDGSFRFLDSKQKPVATFEGVRFRSNFRNATALQGNARIEKTSLRDRFFLEALQSPLKYDPDELDLSNITARAAGGEITGRFNMRPADADSPFTVEVKFEGLEVDTIVADAGGPLGMVQGRLEGHLQATGKTADPNALSGAGEIHLREGQVRQYSLLVALGQLLQIDELSRLQFDQAQVKYHITPGVVTIDELVLSSSNIRLSAVGTISFNGELRLNSQLAINENIRRQLFRPIRENFQPIEQPGFAAVNFEVNGTVNHPRTNLMDKVVGAELKDLGGVISSLLRGKRDRRKKRDNIEVAAPMEAVRDSAVQPSPPSEPSPPKGEAAEPPGPPSP